MYSLTVLAVESYTPTRWVHTPIWGGMVVLPALYHTGSDKSADEMNRRHSSLVLSYCR